MQYSKALDLNNLTGHAQISKGISACGFRRQYDQLGYFIHSLFTFLIKIVKDNVNYLFRRLIAGFLAPYTFK